MSTFQYIMLGFGLLYAVVAPIVLVKAFWRKEWQRLYELAVMSLFVACWAMETVFSAVFQQAGPLFRWPLMLSTALFLSNWFGFSGCFSVGVGHIDHSLVTNKLISAGKLSQIRGQ
jgi:hypothetical protein